MLYVSRQLMYKVAKCSRKNTLELQNVLARVSFRVSLEAGKEIIWEFRSLPNGSQNYLRNTFPTFGRSLYEAPHVRLLLTSRLISVRMKPLKTSIQHTVSGIFRSATRSSSIRIIVRLERVRYRLPCSTTYLSRWQRRIVRHCVVLLRIRSPLLFLLRLQKWNKLAKNSYRQYIGPLLCLQDSV